MDIEHQNDDEVEEKGKESAFCYDDAIAAVGEPLISVLIKDKMKKLSRLTCEVIELT